MKKIQRTTREAIIYLTSKALVLCGVAAAFAGCAPMYGTPPPPRTYPYYWSDQAPEQVDPLTEPKTKTITKTETKNNTQYEQTAEISTEDGSADRR